MRGGDISNESPPRIAVTLDCILEKEIKIKKVMGIPVPSEEVRYSRISLAMFWRFANNNGYTLELIGYGYSQKEMDSVLEDLDNLGTNPFNYAKAYASYDYLVTELPYRPELKYVVDIPQRGLRYGSWYLDLGAVNGSRQ